MQWRQSCQAVCQHFLPIRGCMTDRYQHKTSLLFSQKHDGKYFQNSVYISIYITLMTISMSTVNNVDGKYEVQQLICICNTNRLTWAAHNRTGAQKFWRWRTSQVVVYHHGMRHLSNYYRSGTLAICRSRVKSRLKNFCVRKSLRDEFVVKIQIAKEDIYSEK